MISTTIAFLFQVAAPVADLIPWDKLAAGGAAALVTGILIYVLKQTREQHRECNATIEKVTGDFSKTVGESTETFSKTIADQLEKARESHESREKRMAEEHERREARMHEALRERRTGP